jgi:hypothetical protein
VCVVVLTIFDDFFMCRKPRLGWLHQTSKNILGNVVQNIYSGYTSSIKTIPPQSGHTSLHPDVLNKASGSVKNECWIYLAKASRT